MLYDSKKDVDAVGALLLNAADLLEKRGWVQHAYEDTLGRICAVAAINKAQQSMLACTDRYMEDLGVVRTRVDARLRVAKFAGAWCLPSWNDQRGRTQKEVVDAFRAAAYADFGEK